MSADAILLSWVARNNDPFKRKRDGSFQTDDDGERIPGPTLNLLFDEDSPHRGEVSDVVLLTQQSPEEESRGQVVFEETQAAVRERDTSINMYPKYWRGSDPTDHRALFGFLQKHLPVLRRQFAGRELVIHVSPGTPAMQTVWVLMAETGYVQEPFSVVKSVPQRFRAEGDPAVVPAKVGIDTFYKAYQAARPRHAAGEEEALLWDPAQVQSETLREVFTEARRLARLKIPLLIMGERGTGKTTLASWIRTNSPYRRKEADDSWPSVPCGQYSGDTMRSELFGYRKGAFTGAKKDHEGLLAEADGDTLFLDEIADIAPQTQRLLIRALEEGTYTPVGAVEPEESDFRLVTATNRPWRELTDRLDADFLDRISPLTLRMPALREIPEDLPWLWRSVFEHAAARADVEPGTLPLSEDDHEQIVGELRAHALPGNLRDLFRAAYRLFAALGDPLEPMESDTALDYALSEGLRAPHQPTGDRASSQQLAEAFARGTPLDTFVEEHGRVETKAAVNALRGYLGRELRALGRRRDVEPEELCDVGGRTLLNWVR